VVDSGRIRLLGLAGLLVIAPAAVRAATPAAGASKVVAADAVVQSGAASNNELTGKVDAAGKSGAAGKSDSVGKPDAAPAARTERVTSKEVIAPAPDKVTAPADDVQPPKAAKPKVHKRVDSEAGPDKARIGEGPSPASPSPMTMSGLRDEARRDGAPGKIDPAAAPRTKVEQMLAEITGVRQALHEDTARLEAMMMQDANEPPGAGAAASPGQPGKPTVKNPLDVLAKALRGIKPELAAPIVARLDRRLAANVLLHMPPIDAGKIMGALKPDTAAELATQITMRAPHGEKKR
jgi:flagellar motility protein MotE (MotC chaperone)